MRPKNTIGYMFIVAASIVITLAGIKLAASIIVPFILAVFIAIILTPFYNLLNKKKIPKLLSLFIVLIVFLGLFTLVGIVVGGSVQSFTQDLPSYEKILRLKLHSLYEFTSALGIEVPEEDIIQKLNPSMVFQFAASTLRGMGNTITHSFVVLLMVIFMIVEAGDFVKKMQLYGEDKNTMTHIEEIGNKIKHYMALKTIISLVTGIIVSIMLLVFGLDYAYLWGVLAFLLNFIPNIGSIIAAVPAVILAIIQFDFVTAGFIGMGYVIINIIVGSIIEPKVMGRGLGLSTLVVFLSLIFWGWLLGPVGMLLSIPLTIMAKIALDASPDSKWIGDLLGPVKGGQLSL